MWGGRGWAVRTRWSRKVGSHPRRCRGHGGLATGQPGCPPPYYSMMVRAGYFYNRFSPHSKKGRGWATRTRWSREVGSHPRRSRGHAGLATGQLGCPLPYYMNAWVGYFCALFSPHSWKGWVWAVRTRWSRKVASHSPPRHKCAGYFY